MWLSTWLWIGHWIKWPLVHTTRKYSQYNSLTELHIPNVPVSTAHIKSCLHIPALSWLWTNCHWLSFRLPYTTDLVAPVVFLNNSLTRLSQSTQFILVSVSVVAGTCLTKSSPAGAVCPCLLLIYCVSTDVVPLCVSRPLPRNDCCSRAVSYQWLFLWLHNFCFEQICHNMIKLRRKNRLVHR
jgi:hypothetical protein